MIEHINALIVAEPWLLMGLAIACGLLASLLLKFFKLPSVVGYLIAGVILGSSGLELLSRHILHELEFLSDLVLSLVAFTIGTELTWKLVQKTGWKLLVIILAESLGAFLLVAGVVYLVTHKLHYALIFGAMAPASAPAGTVAVLQEYRARGPLTNLLLGVVGLDDALAIMIYAFAATTAKVCLAGQLSLLKLLAEPVMEISGGLLLGGVMGLILALILRSVKSRGTVLSITLAVLFMTTGLANHLHFSLILTDLVVGIMVANVSPRVIRKTFNAINDITPPLYVIFFIMAGAHLELYRLPAMGILGIGYLLGRSAGLIGGAYCGARWSGADEVVRRYLGLGILSQAGVAVGLALMVAKEFSPLGPEGQALAHVTINTIAATTIVFEIIGPICTKIAIVQAGEVEVSNTEEESAPPEPETK